LIFAHINMASTPKHNPPVWNTSTLFDSPTIKVCSQEQTETSPTFQRATFYLSNNRPTDALELYSEILAQKSPGHPVAFLNRSICYLLLDFPSLAVTDACKFLTLSYCVRNSDKMLTLVG
jgi:hypothetical protein